MVTHGQTRSAANIDKSWIDAPAEKIFEDVLQRDIYLMNDADAAGVAEVHYGAAKGHPGLVLLTTLGTGIGTALIYRGVLIPNSELGHIEVDGARRRDPGRRQRQGQARAVLLRVRASGCSATTSGSRRCSGRT